MKKTQNDTTFFGVFRMDELEKYSLTPLAVTLLLWFFWRTVSGETREYPLGKSVYYGLDYECAAKSLLTNISAIRDNFNRLCGSYRGKELHHGLEYPLTKLVIPTVEGKQCYFRFNEKPLNRIVIGDGPISSKKPALISIDFEQPFYFKK